MKRFINIFLIAAIIYGSAGYVLTYFLVLKSVKRQAFERINATRDFTSCTKFVVNSALKKEIHFESGLKKEFRYQEYMYDIVCSQQEDGLLVIYAIKDLAESNLVELFKDFMSQGAKSFQLTFSIFVSVFNDLLNDNHFLKCPSFDFDFQFHTTINFKLLKFYKSILKPPPDIFVQIIPLLEI